MAWPEGADGDVFRNLEAHNFDFGKESLIEFIVEFDQWPPAEAALDVLDEMYDDVSLVEPDAAEQASGKSGGYVQIQVEALLDYEFVVALQAQLTRQMAQFNARCQSWDVEVE